jgi:hypothetical protein
VGDSRLLVPVALKRHQSPSGSFDAKPTGATPESPSTPPAAATRRESASRPRLLSTRLTTWMRRMLVDIRKDLLDSGRQR